MSRGRRAKEIDSVIDVGAARLDKIPETELAERVQKLAATTGSVARQPSKRHLGARG